MTTDTKIMCNTETPKLIKKIVDVFHLFRMWRRSEDDTSAFRKQVTEITYVSFQVLFGLSVTLGAFVSDDKIESIYLTGMGIGLLVLSVKLAFIVRKKETLNAFIQELGAHYVEDREEFVKVNKKVKDVMKLSSSFILMSVVGCSVVTIISLPVFSNEKRLAFNVWFPLDWKNDTFAYWIAFVFASIGLSITVITIMFTVIVWYLMMNCAIKYQVVGSQLRNIVPPTKRTVKKKKMSEAEKEKLFIQELIGLIKTHQNIQNTIDRFKSCFANLFFAQITTSGICICGAVYVLTFGNENLPQTMAFVVNITYNIFDIFMVMYFGNEIKLSSDRLSYCLFESNWIERSQSYKKYIIIMAEVFKQPHELVVGALYPLNLETFTSIVNGAYSMFNILQSFN